MEKAIEKIVDNTTLSGTEGRDLRQCVLKHISEWGAGWCGNRIGLAAREAFQAVGAVTWKAQRTGPALGDLESKA